MKRIFMAAVTVTGLASALGFGSVAGCHRPEASVAPGPQPPVGQIWLSAEKAKDAKIEVAVAGEQNIDDTILMSGKVTFDDQRAGHVFSPVTGRVMRIDAQLG